MNSAFFAATEPRIFKLFGAKNLQP